MKKLLLLLLCPLLLLTACGIQTADEDEPFSADFTIRPPESLTEIYFDVPLSTEPDNQTEILATSLPDDANVLQYADLRSLFSQSVFAGDSASAALWTQPIRYTVDGDYTQEDRGILSDMATDLTQITSFPGMRETEAKTANVIVRFSDVEDAQFTFTLDAYGAITEGQITIPTSLPSWQRQAKTVEKMFRLFGFFHTANTTLDSILSETPADYMTEADLILLEAMYGQMEPGMTRKACLQAFENYFQPSKS